MASHRREGNIKWLQFFHCFADLQTRHHYRISKPRHLMQLCSRLRGSLPLILPFREGMKPNLEPSTRYIRSSTPGFRLHRYQSPVTHVILYAVHHHEFTAQRIPPQTRQGLPSNTAPHHHNEMRVSQWTRMSGENFSVTMALSKKEYDCHSLQSRDANGWPIRVKVRAAPWLLRALMRNNTL